MEYMYDIEIDGVGSVRLHISDNAKDSLMSEEFQESFWDWNSENDMLIWVARMLFEYPPGLREYHYQIDGMANLATKEVYLSRNEMEFRELWDEADVALVGHTD